MSQLVLNQEAMPNTPPAANKAVVNLDLADGGRVKILYADGHTDILSPIGWRDRNFLLNPEFALAQRQVPGTLTTYSSTTARVYAADRWAMVNSVASLQFHNVDTNGASVAGLQARFTGEFKQITNPGKFVLLQVLEGTDSSELAGRTIRIQFKARATVTVRTLRLGLLYIGTGGTVDTLPTTIASAFGVAGTDPTWGTNLAVIAPISCEATGSISNNGSAGVSCPLTAAFQRFSATFVVPAGTSFLNLIAAIWTNDIPATNDIIQISECGLYNGSEIRDYYPRSLGDELTACQRYYEKTFAIAVAPAQNAGAATGALSGPVTIAGATALAWRIMWRFAVRKRVAPSAAVTGIVTYSPNAASAQPADITTPVAMTSVATSDNTDAGVNITATGGTGGVVGDMGAVHASADCDI